MTYRRTAGIAVGIGLMLIMSVAASSASAAKFTASGAGAKLVETTKEDHVLELTGSDVVCEDLSFEGETEGSPAQGGGVEATIQLVRPVYEDCEAFGFTNADVETSECWYAFFASGSMALTGCTLNGILITVSIPFIAKCVTLVPNQPGISGVIYDNIDGHMDFTFNMSEIETKVLTSTGACALTVGTHNNATYKGKSTLDAEGATFTHD